MSGARKLKCDVASAVALGKRETQEDAITADFPAGADVGFLVLADGMGGHNAGDIASKIVVDEVASTLKGNFDTLTEDPSKVRDALRKAAFTANDKLAAHSKDNPETNGMGATLIAVLIMRDALFWISVGDSVLYLMRKGEMRKLNQDHSLAPQIDYMVKQGLLSEEAGRNHPDRNCLTSALRGEDIPFIDCPERPMKMIPGDVILAASDGLPFLAEREIARILSKGSATHSAALADHLLASLERLDHPEQDNVCFSVVRMSQDGALESEAPSAKAEPEQAQVPEAEPLEALPMFSLLGRLRVFRSGTIR